jgi:hypothetical protein
MTNKQIVIITISLIALSVFITTTKYAYTDIEFIIDMVYAFFLVWVFIRLWNTEDTKKE